MQKPLGRNTVVLLGLGHTNAHVLRMWKMKPVKNAQLVCVSNFPVVTYSGMMPGVLSRQYQQSEMEIDLVRLCGSAGARLLIGNVSGIDSAKNELLFEDRPPLSFDVLSIGIGSRPTFGGVEINCPEMVIPIKPMQTFLDRLHGRLSQLSLQKKVLKISVVGGGVGSIETAFCLWERFKHHASESEYSVEIHLVTGSTRIGTGLLDSTSNRVEQQLEKRGIRLSTGARVQSIDQRGMQLVDGRHIDSDIVIWATNAIATELSQKFNFEKDERGFLLTDYSLTTKTNRDVFAVGDCGTIEGSGLPKAGVYAVRQGPVLWRNIQNKLANRPLETYRPQTGFLKLINLGDNIAIAEYKGRSFAGRFWWMLKDRIDRKFMRMYQKYDPMKMKPPTAEEELPMKCLGCGGKVGSEILSHVLGELDVPQHPDVIIGLENPDDAAVVRTHGNQVTVTTDFFAAPFDDPYLVGRIAMLNSASDCFVMGAQPSTALAIVQIPLGHPRAQMQVMRELMAGSIDELRKMGATMVGGHTIEGPRLTIGFTILGNQISDVKTKGLLQPGDQLVMSKPLGTGALMAAMMDCDLPAASYLPLMNSMLASNQIAMDLIQKFPVSAITDVTGFGLAGHLGEMLLASNVAAEINLEHLAVLPGFDDVVAAGIQSTLAPDNRAVAAKIDLGDLDVEADRYACLFDPQTSGGLLLGVARDDTESVLDYLKAHGFEQSCRIGEVTEQRTPSLRVV